METPPKEASLTSWFTLCKFRKSQATQNSQQTWTSLYRSCHVSKQECLGLNTALTSQDLPMSVGL